MTALMIISILVIVAIALYAGFTWYCIKQITKYEEA